MIGAQYSSNQYCHLKVRKGTSSISTQIKTNESQIISKSSSSQTMPPVICIEQIYQCSFSFGNYPQLKTFYTVLPFKYDNAKKNVFTPHPKQGNNPQVQEIITATMGNIMAWQTALLFFFNRITLHEKEQVASDALYNDWVSLVFYQVVLNKCIMNTLTWCWNAISFVQYKTKHGQTRI